MTIYKLYLYDGVGLQSDGSVISPYVDVTSDDVLKSGDGVTWVNKKMKKVKKQKGKEKWIGDIV